MRTNEEKCRTKHSYPIVSTVVFFGSKLSNPSSQRHFDGGEAAQWRLCPSE